MAKTRELKHPTIVPHNNRMKFSPTRLNTSIGMSLVNAAPGPATPNELRNDMINSSLAFEPGQCSLRPQSLDAVRQLPRREGVPRTWDRSRFSPSILRELMSLWSTKNSRVGYAAEPLIIRQFCPA